MIMQTPHVELRSSMEPLHWLSGFKVVSLLQLTHELVPGNTLVCFSISSSFL